MNLEHSKICRPNFQNAAGNKSVHSYMRWYSHWNIMVDLKNDIFGKLSVKGGLKSSFWSSLRSDDWTNQEPLSLSEFSARLSIFAILHRKASPFTGFGLGFFLVFTQGLFFLFILPFRTHRTKRKIRVNKLQHARDKRMEEKRLEIENLRPGLRRYAAKNVTEHPPDNTFLLA